MTGDSVSLIVIAIFFVILISPFACMLFTSKRGDESDRQAAYREIGKRQIEGGQ